MHLSSDLGKENNGKNGVEGISLGRKVKEERGGWPLT